MDTLERILSLISESQIPQNEFSNKIGVNNSAISEWKKGKTRSYLKCLDKIASVLNVSVDYLLCKTDIKSNDMSISLICEKTGLSEENVTKLVLLQENKLLLYKLQTVESEDDIHQHNLEKPHDIDILNLILEEMFYTNIIHNASDLIYFAKKTSPNVLDEMENEEKKIEFMIKFPSIYSELQTNNLYTLTENEMKKYHKNLLSLSFSDFVERLSHSQYQDKMSEYYRLFSLYEEETLKSRNEDFRKRIKENAENQEDNKQDE